MHRSCSAGSIRHISPADQWRWIRRWRARRSNSGLRRPLGLSVEDAALGIHRVVNAQMVEGIRLVSIRRGLDPRRFTLVALGGAGPIHATALAAELGIGSVLIPRHPGVLSAAGLLAAPIEHEVATAFPRPLAGSRVCRRAPRAGRTGWFMRAADGGGEHRRACLCRSSTSPMSGTSANLITWKCRSRCDASDPLAALYRDFLALHDRIYGHATRAARRDRQPACGASCRRQRPSGRRRLSSARCRSAQAAACDPRGRHACAGAGGDLPSRRDAGRLDIAPALRSWNRTTPRRWSSQAGAERCWTMAIFC